MKKAFFINYTHKKYCMGYELNRNEWAFSRLFLTQILF